MKIVKLERQTTLLRTAAFQKLLLPSNWFLKSSLRFSFPSEKKALVKGMFVKLLRKGVYMAQNTYTGMMFAAVCSWALFWENCKQYHTDCFTSLNVNRDVRDEGCLLATLGLNVFFLVSLPIPPTSPKLSKQWGISTIINCIYSLAMSWNTP